MENSSIQKKKKKKKWRIVACHKHNRNLDPQNNIEYTHVVPSKKKLGKHNHRNRLQCTNLEFPTF